MKRYGFVKNGVILKGPTSLPKAWDNISGFDKLSSEILAQYGWLEWILVETEGDVIVGSSLVIESNRIVETQNRRSFTQQEKEEHTATKAMSIREQRNRYLLESDWTQLDDAPCEKQSWVVYRQNLRDITLQSNFPEGVNWPTKPK